MNEEDFNDAVEVEISRIQGVLFGKNRNYNPGDDKLATFKKAAAIQGNTPEQALLGMASKHLVSVTDMVKSDDYYPPEVWDEKVGDSIVYFILLRALVIDTDSQRASTDIAGAHGGDAITLNQHFPTAPGSVVLDTSSIRTD